MSARAARGLAAATGLVALATLASRLVGFGRWLVQSSQVGATCVGEAYTSANTVPNVVYEVAAGGALAAAVVPIVAGFLGQGRREEANATITTLLTWVVAVLVPLGIVVAALSRPIAGALIGDEHCTGQVDLTAAMIVWFAVQIPLYGIGIVASGALAAHHRFLAAALAPLMSSLVVIAGYLGYGALAPAGGPASGVSGEALALLAGGTTAGVVALSLPLLIPLRRLGIALRPSWRFPDGVGRRIAGFAAAGVVALVAQQLAVLVVVMVSNGAAQPGVINAYQYGQAVYLLPYAVLAVPIATTVVPRLATDLGAGALAQVPGRAAAAIRLVIVLCGIAAGVLLGAAQPIGRFFALIDAGRGHTGGLDVGSAVATVLTWCAPGLVGFGLVALAGRAALVAGRTRAAATAQAIGWGLAAAIPAGAVLAGATTGLQRLAAIGGGASVGMSVAAVLLVQALRRGWGPHVTSGLTRATAAAVVAMVSAAVAGRFVAAAFGTPGLPGTLGAGVAAGLAGALVAVAVAQLIDPRTVRSAAARRGDGADTSTFVEK